MGAISYYLETYGCALNTADSDMIAGHLGDRGVKRVLSPDEAHVIILNTCGVKEPTEDRIIHRLEELSKLARPIIIAGCLPVISLRRVQRAIPNYAAILGPQSIETLGLIVDRVMKGERGLLHLEPDTGSKLRFFEDHRKHRETKYISRKDAETQRNAEKKKKRRYLLLFFVFSLLPLFFSFFCLSLRTSASVRLCERCI